MNKKKDRMKKLKEKIEKENERITKIRQRARANYPNAIDRFLVTTNQIPK